MNNNEVRDTIILGSGPAGLAAALYAGRASLKPLVITGNEFGGQINTTSEVENYPGFSGETGPELIEVMKSQAERFGAEITMDYIEKVDLNQHPFKLSSYGKDYYAKSLILTVGASYRKLGVPGEAELAGRGVSYCATCDGFFFSGKEIENYLLLNILTVSIVFMVWYRAERAIHILKDNGLARYDE